MMGLTRGVCRPVFLGIVAVVLAAPAGKAQNHRSRDRDFGDSDSEMKRSHGSFAGTVEPARIVVIELYDVSSHVPVDRAESSTTGDFSFPDVPTGDYRVRVLDRQGNVLREEFIRVTAFGLHTSIRLPETDPPQRPASGTVSVAQLGRKVPKEAQKEFDKAMKAEKSGKSEEVIQHLEKALQIAPDYMEAHNNLGARFLIAGQTEKAAEHFRRAVELDPSCAQAHANLALALASLQRLEDAGPEAKEALRLDPANYGARFVLGFVLATENQDEQAAHYLETVADHIPKARLVLAECLVRLRRLPAAIAQLKAYLSGPNTELRQEAEQLLARLTAAQGIAESKAGVGQ